MAKNFVVQWGIASDPKSTKFWEARPILDDDKLESNQQATIVFATE